PPGAALPTVAAVIDVGSNSVLLLTVTVDESGRGRAIDEALATTRLGAGLARGGRLDAAARARTQEAVVAFTAPAPAGGGRLRGSCPGGRWGPQGGIRARGHARGVGRLALRARPRGGRGCSGRGAVRRERGAARVCRRGPRPARRGGCHARRRRGRADDRADA